MSFKGLSQKLYKWIKSQFINRTPIVVLFCNLLYPARWRPDFIHQRLYVYCPIKVHEVKSCLLVGLCNLLTREKHSDSYIRPWFPLPLTTHGNIRINVWIMISGFTYLDIIITIMQCQLFVAEFVKMTFI